MAARPSLGAPPIAPIRATAMPAVKTIPAAKQPPAKVREVAFAGPHTRPFRPVPVQLPASAQRQPVTGTGASFQRKGGLAAPASTPAPWPGAGVRPAPAGPERPPGRIPEREEVVRYTTADIATKRPDQGPVPAGGQHQQGLPVQQRRPVETRTDHPQARPTVQIPRPVQQQSASALTDQVRPRVERPLPSSPPPRPVMGPAPGERQTSPPAQAGTAQRREPIPRRPEPQEHRRPNTAGEPGRGGSMGTPRPVEPVRVTAPPRPAAVPPAVQPPHEQHRTPPQPQGQPPQAQRDGQHKAPDHRPGPAQARGERRGGQPDAPGSAAPAREQAPGRRPG